MEWEDHYDSLIVYWAERYGRDPRQVKRQIRIESDFYPRSRSPVGAEGLMQFMPATWRDQADPKDDPFDPEASITAGCKYMKWLEGQLGSLPLALAAYNCGIGRVHAASGSLVALPKETQEYVTKCMNFEGEVLCA